MIITRKLPMRVTWQSADTLMIAPRRSVALGRLLLVLGFTVVFYHVLWAPADSPGHVTLLEHVHARLQVTWLNGVLVLLPLAVLPDALASVRGLLGRGSLCFDRRSGEVRRNRQVLVLFADVSGVCLTAVNGTCEEFNLSVRLHDGREIGVMTSGASSNALAVANELAGLLGVQIQRGEAHQRAVAVR